MHRKVCTMFRRLVLEQVTRVFRRLKSNHLHNSSAGGELRDLYLT